MNLITIRSKNSELMVMIESERAECIDFDVIFASSRVFI